MTQLENFVDALALSNVTTEVFLFLDFRRGLLADVPVFTLLLFY